MLSSRGQFQGKALPSPPRSGAFPVSFSSERRAERAGGARLENARSALSAIRKPAHGEERARRWRSLEKVREAGTEHVMCQNFPDVHLARSFQYVKDIPVARSAHRVCMNVEHASQLFKRACRAPSVNEYASKFFLRTCRALSVH